MPNELDSSSTIGNDKGPTATNAAFAGALYGKHRGTVLSRNDPDKQGRVKVALPQIYGDIDPASLPWVYPSSGFFGTSSTDHPAGGSVMVPPVGAPVFVEFENGDHRYPIYSGASAGKPGFPDTMPGHTFAANGSPDNFSFTTPRGTTIQLDERAGQEKVLMRGPEGNYVSMTASGLIEVNSKATVSIKAATLVAVQCDTQIQLKGSQIFIYGTSDMVIEGANSVSINSDAAVHVQAPKINLNCKTGNTAIPELKPVQTDSLFDGS